MKLVIFDPDKWHTFQLIVFIKKVEVGGWSQFYKRGPKKGQRKAKRRFFKADTANRHKLITDSVCEAIGIDDSVLAPKMDDKRQSDHERICIRIVERKDQTTRTG